MVVMSTIRDTPPRLVGQNQNNAPDTPTTRDRTVMIQTGMLGALGLRPNQVDLEAKSESSFEFTVRFHKTNMYEILPSGSALKQKVNEHMKAGTSKQLEGSFKGASHVMVGTVHFDESSIHGDKRNHIRVTMRLVESGSGVIIQAGDAQVTCGSVILGKTMAEVFNQARQRMRE